LITFELYVDNLQHFCKDEIEPFLKETTQGLWRWNIEYREIETNYGEKRMHKRIHGIWFDDEADANFFILKYPNLIK
jgi:hypothetical protein